MRLAIIGGFLVALVLGLLAGYYLDHRVVIVVAATCVVLIACLVTEGLKSDTSGKVAQAGLLAFVAVAFVVAMVAGLAMQNTWDWVHPVALTALVRFFYCVKRITGPDKLSGSNIFE